MGIARRHCTASSTIATHVHCTPALLTTCLSCLCAAVAWPLCSTTWRPALTTSRSTSSLLLAISRTGVGFESFRHLRQSSFQNFLSQRDWSTTSSSSLKLYEHVNCCADVSFSRLSCSLPWWHDSKNTGGGLNAMFTEWCFFEMTSFGSVQILGLVWYSWLFMEWREMMEMLNANCLSMVASQAFVNGWDVNFLCYHLVKASLSCSSLKTACGGQQFWFLFMLQFFRSPKEERGVFF